MNSRSMFFRCSCLLPGGFRLKQERFNKGWMLAGDISVPGLDATLRRSGWHFRSFHFHCSRLGCGRTEESAVSHATTRGIKPHRRQVQCCRGGPGAGVQLSRLSDRPGHGAGVPNRETELKARSRLQTGRGKAGYPLGAIPWAAAAWTRLEASHRSSNAGAQAGRFEVCEPIPLSTGTTARSHAGECL